MKKNNNSKFNKNNNKNTDNRKNNDLKSQLKKVDVGIQDGVFIYVEPLTINEFAKKINRASSEIIKYFFIQGKVLNLNSVLTEEQMGEVCLELGYDFKKEIQINEDNFLDHLSIDKSGDLEKRPPIITIMGHVDHGKTTLLDSIRNTNVADNEDGRITQNIGAYQVKWKDNLITFIDTPGHEAFSAMRARGADLTDIIILVVAADDGLKPQTEEAIDHALFAKVPIIIFVNKIDKIPNPNLDKIMSQLADKNVLVEEWGGNHTMIKGSALTKQGVDKLLEAIVLHSELLSLKANNNKLAYGVTIEAQLDKGMGPVASLLVQNGTLMVGDYILVGEYYGKIRSMVNDKEEQIKVALPSTPVKISGLNGVPKSGDKWVVAKDEKTIKDLANKRQVNANKKRTSNLIKIDGEGESKTKELNLIIKTDVFGSLEALKSTLSSIEVDGAKINIIRSSVGQPSETDINFAKSANALIFLFKLKPTPSILDIAKSNNIEIKTYNIIYEIKDAVEKILKGTLDPIYVEEKIGEVEVRQLWTHSSVGTIAGCKVLTGEIARNAFIRLLRKKELIVENKKISSLKHGKDTINKVEAGKECGFTVDGFNDFIVGDIVEIYKMVEKKHE